MASGIVYKFTLLHVLPTLNIRINRIVHNISLKCSCIVAKPGARQPAAGVHLVS